MTVGMGILRAGDRSAREIAAHSRAALDRVLAHPGELWVAVASDEGTLPGAFQRSAGLPAGPVRVRRGSGGPEVRVGAGTVHVALALSHPGALVACDEKRIVNRAVRPLLRALTRVGALAHFFGRDWVSVRHRPAAWVGFAHDAGTRRTLFEAFVAVRTPFHLPLEGAERPSFLGKTPGTLEEIVGASIEPQRVVDAIVDAYVAAWAVEPIDMPVGPPDSVAVVGGAHDESLGSDEIPPADPPWAATVEEAIGTLGAGPDAGGTFRVGGDLLVSRDALARLRSRRRVGLGRRARGPGRHPRRARRRPRRRPLPHERPRRHPARSVVPIATAIPISIEKPPDARERQEKENFGLPTPSAALCEGSCRLRAPRCARL